MNQINQKTSDVLSALVPWKSWWPKAILSGFILLAVACSDRGEDINPDFAEEEIFEEPVGYQGVDEELWEYFERFELEAASRGIAIDLREEAVTGVIREIDSENVAGQCNFNRVRANHVTIDESFWRRAGDRFREFVVFHELGHCVLLRDHLETADVNNICTSIMRSGTGSCFDNYTRLTRNTYLNELFDREFEGDIFAVAHH